MPKSARRLGKGLNALIGPRTGAPFHHRAATALSDQAPLGYPENARISMIPVDQISPNPRQPRTDIDKNTLQQLADSIRHSGVLQPVLVRSTGERGFEMIAGERRWRAAQLAGLEAIPAIIRQLSDAEAFETALIENLQREDLGALERARAYQQLVDIRGASMDDVATCLGESRANIANYLRLLKLASEVQELISAGELGMGQARALAGISDPQRQLALARLAVRRDLSVRQVEALAKHTGVPQAPAAPAPGRQSAHLSEVEQAFNKAFGLPVRLFPGRKKNSGRVVIRYNSLDEFDRIAEKIGIEPLSE